MRKNAKFLIAALLAVVLIVSCIVVFAAAEDKGTIYVSSTGRVDGVGTKADPIGPGLVTGDVTVTYKDPDNKDQTKTHTFADTPYYQAIEQLKSVEGYKFVPANNTFVKASPLYRAFEKIGQGNTGTVVIMDEIGIEVADRMEDGSAAEYKLPKVGTVTVTTNDGTTDYGASGAKLVLDQRNWATVNLQLAGSLTLKNIALEYRHDEASTGTFEKSFNIYVIGNTFVADEGVTVTSFSYKSGSAVASDVYPNLYGGARGSSYDTATGRITIKSGKWGTIFGSGHGVSATSAGSIKAAVINIEGGEVAAVRGTGSEISGRNHSYLAGDYTLNITGGKVGTVQILGAKGIGGAVKVTVSKPATVETIIKGANTISGGKTPTSVSVTYDEGYVGTTTGFAAGEVKVNPNVVYISANGTGDGKTPDAPLGNANVTGTIYYRDGKEVAFTFNDKPYAEALAEMKAQTAGSSSLAAQYKTLLDKDNAMLKANALYRGFEALGGKSGTVVIVGQVDVDIADRMELNQQGPAEFKLPSNKGTITVTSKYNGVDYSAAANGGAKLVFDRSVWNSINVQFASKTVWENLTMIHKQDTTQSGSWAGNMMIFCAGYDTVFGTGIKSGSQTGTGANAGSYPYIFAGLRYNPVTTDADGQTIEIKSGTWHGAFAAGHGQSGNLNQGKVTGNVTITVSGQGTNVVELGAGGFYKRTMAGVVGNVTLNIANKGRVQNYIYAQSGAGVQGKVVINAGADLGITSTFKGLKYTDGNTHSYTPTGVELNFYTTSLPEDKIFNKADFEAAGNVYNPIDKKPVTSGTPAVTGDQKVIYIADTPRGSGDGSSASNAMGRDAGYNAAEANAFKGDAFYKALQANDYAIVKNGGVIVIVGPTTIDNADAIRTGLADWQWPGSAGTKNITVTSYYEGVDYREDLNGGAKFTFDTSKNGLNVRFKAPMTWEYLNIEAKIDSTRGSGKTDDGVVMISTYGNKFVFDEELVVTCTDVGGSFKNYPNINGYDRLGSEKPASTKANPDITINSGTWGKVFGSNYGACVGGNRPFGALEGNVTITVNGGKITQLVGTSRLDWDKIEATVKGDVTINVNGGTIDSIYGTNHRGIDGKIVLNIAEGAKVTTRAWAYYQYTDNSNTANKPVDSTINYHRQAIGDDMVKYWVAANGTGTGSVTPPTPPTPPTPTAPSVIYIAANGTGDGSAPDKPLGNVANYNNQNWADNLFYRAMSKLTDGGTIVVVGDVSLDTAESRVPTAEGQGKSPSEFKLPALKGTVVITSVYGGKDYRDNAKFILDADKCNTMFVTFQSAATFENINIEYKYDPNDANGWGVPVAIAANGYKLVIGDNVKVTSLNADTNKAGDKYPMLLGGHRYSEMSRSTDLTIKSGKWSTVVAGSFGMSTNTVTNRGIVHGDATLNILGGEIEEVYGTSGSAQPYATVEGTTTINVTGGKISALYGAATQGAKGDIIVTIADTVERVNKAWGYIPSGKAPANATITYDRSVIRDDEVAYWTTATATGDVADQPEKEYYTIYVADVARGTGDGSSPENAIGAEPTYRERYQRMAELFAIKQADRTEAQKNELNSYKTLYRDSAMYRALANGKLASMGGKIVIVGPTTIDANDSIATAGSNGDFQWAISGGSEVIITSVDKGVDYREQGAKLVIDRTLLGVSLSIKTPTRWENLDIEYKYDSSKSTSAGSHTMICCNGNTTVFGEGLEVIPVDVNTAKQSKFYPGIVGGHRFSDQKYDTDVTILSGRWGTCYGGNYGRIAEKKDKDGNVIKDADNKTVYDSYGFLEGNVNFTVAGGKITALIGTCRDDTATCLATVKGNVNINIKGNAEVVKLYAANRNGVEGKITVNVTEDAYIGTAWGFHYTTDGAKNQPADATLNYVRTAIAAADIKYWSAVNASGEGEPGIHGPVIYIASTARGTGDGSSPENAMGNDPNYAKDLKRALNLMASVKDTISKLSKEDQTFVNNVYKGLALYRALSADNNAIIDEGGTIVVVGRLELNSADGLRRSLSEIRWPAAGSKTIKITSKYDGVDYRWKGARVVFDVTNVGVCLETKSPTVWDSIIFEHKYNSKNGTSVDNGALIAAAGNKIVIGYNVSSVANDVNPDESKRKEIYPSICGGGRYSDFKTSTHVTVNGGQWAMVVGGAWSGTNTGSTSIGIGGGKIDTVCGTSKPTSSNSKHIVKGSVWIGLWGGEVKNVYGVGKAGIQWGSVAVGIGKGFTIKGKVYATHPDYKGKAIKAIAYYNPDAIRKNKLVGFTTVTPQTGSTLIYLSAAAVVGLVSTGVVVSKKKKKIDD